MSTREGHSKLISGLGLRKMSGEVRNNLCTVAENANFRLPLNMHLNGLNNSFEVQRRYGGESVELKASAPLVRRYQFVNNLIRQSAASKMRA